MSLNRSSDQIFNLVRGIVPAFSGRPEDLLSEYEVDSFDLMTLRALFEEELGLRFDDQDWIKIKKFSDFIKFGKNSIDIFQERSTLLSNILERKLTLNMPQMNVSGLSEYWYLKEIGDMHWRLIASCLGVPSDRIFDQGGCRLYATFVRIKYTSTLSFRGFQENDSVEMKAELKRFGSFYLSENVSNKGSDKMKAELVTSFVARGGDNSRLYKSLPVEEPKVSLPSFREVPELIERYHQVRKNEVDLAPPGEILFEFSYKLDPYHDINGVGLLYFAAYPHIYDYCEREFMNRQTLPGDWAFISSILSRDIFYLGNADLGDEIIYRLIQHNREGQIDTFVAELFRKSDGRRVSACVSQKKRDL